LRRLSGQDDGFLMLELPEQPMQTIVLAVLRPGPGPVRVEDVQRHMAARLRELPAFRWRVVPVPLGLSHPVFVEDLVRNVALKLNAHADVTWYKVEAENHESIHNHNAYACIEKG